MIRGYSNTSLRNPDCLCLIKLLKYWLLIQCLEPVLPIDGREEYHVKPGYHSVYES